MSYSSKLCKRCSTEYVPTSGSQIVCISCKVLAEKERHQSYASRPEWRENRRKAIRKYYQKHHIRIDAVKRAYRRERAKLNPQLRYESYLRGKDRLKLLRYTAEQHAICFKCGTGWPLHAHHLDENPKNHDINNLKWVCVECHMRIHGKFYNPIVKTHIA